MSKTYTNSEIMNLVIHSVLHLHQHSNLNVNDHCRKLLLR